MANTPPVNFTESAARKVFSLIIEEENTNLKLRAFVVGGGCSGFQYGFTFDEATNDDDTIVIKTLSVDNKDIDVTLLIDPMSLQYLAGADIDYKEDIEGSQFVIRNPNAKTTCGCGNSFDVDADANGEAL